ncbi:MAG: alpha/beta hydrolase [Pedobacter sp.]|nr:MAG: alpha/beta hydrolase [Pedobacter sp.]
MLKLKLSMFAMLFIFSTASSYGQFFEILQTVNVEQYQGKTFSLEGKIFYKDAITNNSWAVLGARSLNGEGKQLKQTLYNDNAGDYFKQGAWSSYQLKGKIEKGAKYLAPSITIAGGGSYYVDEVRLFIKDGKDSIAIPMKNAGFENDSLTSWQSMGLAQQTKLTLTTEKAFSGKQSLLIDNSKLQQTPTLGSNPNAGKYVDVNGIKLYYEIYGEGEPLLLLHGNNSSIQSFEQQVDVLRKKYKVIALDSRGQGKSTADKTKLTYELMAKDVNAFLELLQLKNVNVLGWSDGGNIALILAMQHPDKVSLQQIQAPTLVMAGQHDVVKEKHTKLIAEKIPRGKLLIFKGADHEAPKKIPQQFNQAVLDFFN